MERGRRQEGGKDSAEYEERSLAMVNFSTRQHGQKDKDQRQMTLSVAIARRHSHTNIYITHRKKKRYVFAVSGYLSLLRANKLSTGRSATGLSVSSFSFIFSFEAHFSLSAVLCSIVVWKRALNRDCCMPTSTIVTVVSLKII